MTLADMKWDEAKATTCSYLVYSIKINVLTEINQIENLDQVKRDGEVEAPVIAAAEI